MLQCLGIIRNNPYSAYTHLPNTEKLSHKHFTFRFSEALLAFASGFNSGLRRGLRRNISNNLSNLSSDSQRLKRRRMSHTNPQLPASRLEGSNGEHRGLWCEKQEYCVFCSYLHAKARISVDQLTKPRRVRRACFYCQVHLCMDHFDRFHDSSGQD